MLGTTQPTPDGRTAMRFERRFAHPAEKVWRALTEPSHLHQWFPARVDLSQSPGAEVRFLMPDETKRRLDVTDVEANFGDGRITISDPPRVLEYTWGDETLRWELTPDDTGGCTLVFVNVFSGRPADGVGAAAGWHAALEVLEAILNNKAIDWDAWDRASQLEPDYARSFA